MEVQARISGPDGKTDLSDRLVAAFSAREFATGFMNIVFDVFQIEDAADRPADFQPLRPQIVIPAMTAPGVKLYASGIDARSTAFLWGLDSFDILGLRTATSVLRKDGLETVHYGCSMELDEAIEFPPGSSTFTRILRTKSRWIDAEGNLTEEARNAPPRGLARKR